MSLAAIFPVVILETILKRLAALFLTGAGGDPAAAQHAAAQMLASHNPQTLEELSLAANIVCFSFQALEALGQAADPDMSLTRVLRLRSGAVSLSREADRARRSLAQLQKARQQAQPAEQPQPAQPAPAPQQHAAPARPQTEEERQRDLRIAAGLKRLEAGTAATTQANCAHTDANHLIPAAAASIRPEASPVSMP